MRQELFKTAESVTPKHPDKICDQISDAILDAHLQKDPSSRVAVEVMGGHNLITITGEITSQSVVDYWLVVRQIIGDHYDVQVNIACQSPEIAQGVDTGGAGDQGIMIGYACNDNKAMIPQELYLARSLAQFIFKNHQQDGKTQITICGDRLVTVVASFCQVSQGQLVRLTEQWLKSMGLNQPEKTHFNPAGDWQQGGFVADTGLTGRKLVADNYGPQIPIGGGAFSGKDATKVDRSGAYMARQVAVDYLQKKSAQEVLVKLAYSIGVAEPVMAIAKIDGQIEQVKGYDLTPRGIIEQLGLCQPIFQETAKWGHFGNGFIWDQYK